MYIVHRGLVLNDTLEGVLQLIAEAYAEVAHVDTHHRVDEHAAHFILCVENTTHTSRYEGRYALVEEGVLGIGIVEQLHAVALGEGPHHVGRVERERLVLTLHRSKRQA